MNNLEAAGTPVPQIPTRPTVTARERVTQRAWGAKGPLLFHAEADRLRHRRKRAENKPYHEAYKRRKKKCEIEKWRIATLNINGITSEQRMQHLKHELQEKRIDVAFLQETLYQDTVDQLHEHTIINSGAINNAARNKKWGASIALHKAITPHIEEIEKKKGFLTRVKIGKIAVAPWGPTVSCHLISVYIPNSPREAEAVWNELLNQIAKIPEEDEYIIGGDFNAHMSRAEDTPSTRNGHPKPTGPLGPFFTYDGEDNVNGNNLKSYMYTNGLFSPLTWSPPKRGQEVQATHYTSVPGGRSRILDHILLPKSLKERVEGCAVDVNWTSSPTSPYDHRAVVLTLTPKYPHKTQYDSRKIDERQIQKQISSLIRQDQEHLRKAGNQDDRPDQVHPEAARARARKAEYNSIVYQQTSAEHRDNQKTPGENLNVAITTAANAVYKQKAIQDIKEMQTKTHHPWARSEQAKEIWREKKNKQAEIERIHRLTHRQTRQQARDPNPITAAAIEESKSAREQEVKQFKELTKKLQKQATQDFNEHLRREAEKIEEEDGESDRMLRIWQFVKKWGKNERKEARKNHPDINGKTTPKDQAQEFSTHLLRTQGTAARIEDTPRLVYPRSLWPIQEEEVEEEGQSPRGMRRGGDTSREENAWPRRPVGGAEAGIEDNPRGHNPGHNDRASLTPSEKTAETPPRGGEGDLKSNPDTPRAARNHGKRRARRDKWKRERRGTHPKH